MKTRLVLSSLLLAVIASAGYATAPPSDPAPAAPAPATIDSPSASSATPVAPAPATGLAAIDAAASTLCTEAAESPFVPLPIPVQTCSCLRAPCLIGGNCCGDIPDPYCGQKLKGHNRYAGRCDVLGCEGVCCQS